MALVASPGPSSARARRASGNDGPGDAAGARKDPMNTNVNTNGRAAEPPQDLEQRLRTLLPDDALQDALDGLAPGDVTGQGGLLQQLAGRLLSAALEGEMNAHLGYPKGQAPPDGLGAGSSIEQNGTPPCAAPASSSSRSSAPASPRWPGRGGRVSVQPRSRSCPRTSGRRPARRAAATAMGRPGRPGRRRASRRPRTRARRPRRRRSPGGRAGAVGSPRPAVCPGERVNGGRGGASSRSTRE